MVPNFLTNKTLQPSKIILLDNSEYNLYIHHELTINKQNITVLSTVTNYKQIYDVIKDIRSTIYHAAVYKHVPMVELNVVWSLQ